GVGWGEESGADTQLLLVVVVISSLVLALARKTGLPSTIPLLVAGFGLGLAPGVPRLEPDPAFLIPVLLLPVVYVSTAGASLQLVRTTFWSARLPGALLLLGPALVLAS